MQRETGDSNPMEEELDGGVDFAAAQPEHLYCDDRFVVCTTVGQRAAAETPADLCRHRYNNAAGHFPVPGGLSKAPHYQLPVSGYRRALR